ncbi:FKBP-type peptidyl-prolyl cis-trans isomerase [Pseudomonas agarici]|uniref:FKBP-type peptidyl-prolyl cis-trans isomerase n=1 Tax=Pseudomonas agarici TaxID=46677 RepID=UPI00030A1CE0|nr:FKBP-type peptidyl-prolyl cis-trans isomerase [Pseudomonas agarici]NWB91175.1 FKBP-type peptidyl-prolyl cis-trans isomerase [Pseudomonas agarici]NWC09409.1 FKBP-type peptidyl-prolyl cis-trans isomerase [Pseudomonas agarici]SEL61699.1 FKBP-type peptidyl-prolyl cis-trans isomerase FklB [Pseudomonas agarici]
MSRYLLLSLCLVLPLVQGAPKETTDDAQDLAYSLGASLGERLRQEVPGLQLKALIEGLQQAYQGKPLALKEERIEQILAAHEARIVAESTKPQSETALEAEKEFLAREKAQPGVRELSNGILMTELTPGTGEKVAANGRVQVRYVGHLPNGTVFDQNRQPQWFRLDSVINGWRSALPQMPVGAKWRLVLPSAQAYGADGAGDLIAPYTPLVFDIELLGVTN